MDKERAAEIIKKYDPDLYEFLSYRADGFDLLDPVNYAKYLSVLYE